MSVPKEIIVEGVTYDLVPRSPSPLADTTEKKEWVSKAADGVFYGFNWDKSEEGSTYWHEVYDRLKSIKNGATQ